MTTQDAIDQGYIAVTNIHGRGLCGISPMLFTVGIVVGITEDSYVGRYCYPSMEQAVKGLIEWDGVGDPPGEWIKWKGAGGDRARVKDVYDEYHPDFEIH